MARHDYTSVPAATLPMSANVAPLPSIGSEVISSSLTGRRPATRRTIPSTPPPGWRPARRRGTEQVGAGKGVRGVRTVRIRHQVEEPAFGVGVADEETEVRELLDAAGDAVDVGAVADRRDVEAVAHRRHDLARLAATSVPASTTEACWPGNVVR